MAAYLLPVAAALLLSACGSSREASPDADARAEPPGPRGEEPASGPAAAPELHALFREAWEWELREDPLLATSVGRHAHDDRLPSVAMDDLRRRAERRRAFLDRLGAIDRAGLGREDRISHDMLRRRLEDAVRGFELGEHLLPFTSESGFHTAFARLPSLMPFRSAVDYRNYLARLRAWPEHVEEHLALLERAIEVGVTQPRAVLDGFEVTMETHLVDHPEASVFWAPFERFPAAVPERERERLREEGSRAILESVVPGYRSFLVFFRDRYLPGARATIAAADLPDGEAYYRHQIRRYTTLELAPEEVHELGLQEVARIRTAMDSIVAAVEFRDGFREFLTFLRTDPRFYAGSPEELLEEAAWIAKRMDGKLPSLFGKIPRLPYGIQPVPDHLAPRYTAGRYVSPALGTDEPGWYWVNTYALESRPLYTLTSLTLHEAVPGHHLQHAAQIELEGLPEFRRHTYLSAFGEGWGLYSEWLGIEAGLYDTPYEHFGRLTYEMWRACRLVVDTGMHAMGWSRERAMDFLAANTALSLHEIETETDRYISWPGQALAYKIGEIEIRRLREEAEAALGPDFDVRAFHDAILWHGTVPLPVLRDEVRRFIAETRDREAP